jgi:hypothetical protein
MPHRGLIMPVLPFHSQCEYASRVGTLTNASTALLPTGPIYLHGQNKPFVFFAGPDVVLLIQMCP